MKRLYHCILVLALIGYPVGSQSNWSVTVSQVSINVSL